MLIVLGKAGTVTVKLPEISPRTWASVESCTAETESAGVPESVRVTLASLPGKGVKRVALVAPGFSADCLETLEELAIRGRQTFLDAGGSDFAYLPCLNADQIGIEMLHLLLQRELAGWVGAS